MVIYLASRKFGVLQVSDAAGPTLPFQAPFLRGLHFLSLSRSNRVQFRSMTCPNGRQASRCSNILLSTIPLRPSVSIIAATSYPATTSLPNLIRPLDYLSTFGIDNRFFLPNNQHMSVSNTTACRNPVASYSLLLIIVPFT